MIQKIKKRIPAWGEIWLANLNPTHGTELGKVRPVLVLQNQALLKAEHPSTLVIPLTTQLVDDAAPLRIRIKAHSKLEKDSDLLIDQLRAIDNNRLIEGPLTLCANSLMLHVFSCFQELAGFSDYDEHR